jgi:hypothetical protein
VGSIDAGTRTTPPEGTVGRVTVEGVGVGEGIVVGTGAVVVVDPACESPLDPLLQAPPIANKTIAGSVHRTRRVFVDREAIKPLNLPPRRVLIVMLLRL